MVLQGAGQQRQAHEGGDRRVDELAAHRGVVLGGDRPGGEGCLHGVDAVDGLAEGVGHHRHPERQGGDGDHPGHGPDRTGVVERHQGAFDGRSPTDHGRFRPGDRQVHGVALLAGDDVAVGVLGLGCADDPVLGGVLGGGGGGRGGGGGGQR